MFWLYMPPIVFLAALIALVVILGKKTSLLKKAGAFRRKENIQSVKTVRGEKLGKIWRYFLGFLEWTMHIIKIGIRKAEAGLSGALHKIKEKRIGRKLPGLSPDDFQKEPDDFREDLDIVPAAEEEKEAKQERFGAVDEEFLHKEVTVRKKEEPAPQRIMPELASEDKTKEDALIHRIAENPKDTEAYRDLGDYYLSIGNIKDAKDSFKMVLKLRPRDLKAKGSLREIEMKMRLGN